MDKYEEAINLFMFISIEDAVKIVSKIDMEKKKLLSVLSQKNVDFELASKKVLLQIRDIYLEDSKLSASELGLKNDALSFVVDKMSENAIITSQTILDIKDEGATIDNLKSRIQEKYYNNPLAVKAVSFINTIKTLKEQTIDENFKIPISRIKSEYDTYCIKGYNILFDKYLEITNIIEKIQYLKSLEDALNIVKTVRSVKKLFTYDASVNFIANQNAAIIEMKKIMEERQ